MNWLAQISRCNFWNNSKTTLYYIIKFGKIIHNIEQVNESMITIKESIINALKEVNKLLKSKVLDLEHKLSQSKARINSLDNTIR